MLQITLSLLLLLPPLEVTLIVALSKHMLLRDSFLFSLCLDCFWKLFVRFPGFGLTRRRSPVRPGPPSGVTGSLVRSQGAVASSWGALHLVSRPQEAGKQNLLLHAVLPNLNYLPWPNRVTPSSITSERVLSTWSGLSGLYAVD